jgi:20S proteasome alpha/beta subunit
MCGLYYIALLFISLVVLCQASGARESSASKYDKNVNLFSPSGDLLQVQYAKNAGLLGGSVLASTSKDGEVILCIPVPLKLQLLQDKRSVDKVSKLSDGLWIAFSGLAGDGRALTKAARAFCLDYQYKFGSVPSVRSVASYIGELQHESTLTGGKRPYGVQTILVGTSDDGKGFSLYCTDPSGTYQ